MRNVQVYQMIGFGRERHRVPDCIGKFHQWGLEILEFDSGGASYTVAIVEKQDGTIITTIPTMIQFLNAEVAP